MRAVSRLLGWLAATAMGQSLESRWTTLDMWMTLIKRLFFQRPDSRPAAGRFYFSLEK
jgi:hypothetical protein